MKDALFRVVQSATIAFRSRLKPTDVTSIGIPLAPCNTNKKIPPTDGQDLKKCDFDKKSAFFKKTDVQLDRVNRDIGQLSAAIDASSDAIKAEALPKIQDLHNQTANLKQQLMCDKSAPQSTWDDVKENFIHGYRDLSDSLHTFCLWSNKQIAGWQRNKFFKWNGQEKSVNSQHFFYETSNDSIDNPLNTKKETFMKNQKQTIKSAESQPQMRPVRFEFYHPTARTVCVAGTFNDWHHSATSLNSLGNGRWLNETIIPPGTYEYRFIVDGEWMIDPLMRETVTNQFGEKNSLLTVHSCIGTADPATSHNLSV